MGKYAGISEIGFCQRRCRCIAAGQAQHGTTENLAKRQPLYDKKVVSEPISIGNIPAEWLVPKTANKEKVLIYFHGGCYTGGSANTHRMLVSQIVKRANIAALVIEYRRAPEFPFPAALEDCVASYQYLLSQGHKPESIAFGGDSAGAGLAIATLLYLKEHQLSLPNCAILLCPWVDLTYSFPSIMRSDSTDCMIEVADFKAHGALYIGKQTATNPYISPYFGDLAGLPDLYVQTAAEDMLVDEGEALVEKARKAGVNVEHETQKGAFHLYQAFWVFLSISKKANERLGDFLKKKLGR